MLTSLGDPLVAIVTVISKPPKALNKKTRGASNVSQIIVLLMLRADLNNPKFGVDHDYTWALASRRIIPHTIQFNAQTSGI